MKKQIFLGLLFLFFISCNISPQQIEYGTDACHSCNMTIVDQQHASQIVTTKGKAFKFDAIECMFHSLQGEMKDTEMALHLVADFNQPGQLVDATAAFYLVSNCKAQWALIFLHFKIGMRHKMLRNNLRATCFLGKKYKTI